MKLKNVLLFGVGLIVIVVLVSCQVKIESDVAMSPTTALTDKAKTTAVALETAMLTPTIIQPIITIAQTASPSQTPFPKETVTPTPHPTLSPTPTPLPTLSSDEAVDRVLSLLSNNHNPDCLLPCWWSAVPGQTYWQDVQPYLESFAIGIYYFSHQSVQVAEFPVPEIIDQVGKLNIGYRLNSDNIITSIGVASINIKDYDPGTMMTIYGVPDEVWLKTYSEILPGEVLPFKLIIIYQDKGISFRYYVDAVTDGETVTVCFAPGTVETERPDLFPVGPRIYLWEPGQHKTIDEITNTPDETYYPLEEKTDLTPQTFYEKFTNPNESPCIDTPTALWN